MPPCEAENDMSASSAVLGTYELLECILLHLRSIDLTRARRVCHAWDALIIRSATLHDVRIMAPNQKRRRSYKSNASHEGLGQIPIYSNPSPVTTGIKYHPSIPWPSGHARQFHAGVEYMGHYLNLAARWWNMTGDSVTPGMILRRFHLVRLLGFGF